MLYEVTVSHCHHCLSNINSSLGKCVNAEFMLSCSFCVNPGRSTSIIKGQLRTACIPDYTSYLLFPQYDHYSLILTELVINCSC